ncbi:MAG: DUF3574 domain-containing protein [Planctomycetota bacterium]|nr:DUF3574 domain-containing protein [Planctomycetota bacterium]
MRRRARLAAAVLLLPVLALGCKDDRGREVQPAPVQAPAAGKAWVRTECYFGLNVPAGGRVSDADWQGFLDAEITPRFRDGLTVLDAYGQYLAQDGRLAREPSKLLILFHPPSAEADARLRAIVDAYKRRFRQESVLVARMPAEVRF